MEKVRCSAEKEHILKISRMNARYIMNTYLLRLITALQKSLKQEVFDSKSTCKFHDYNDSLAITNSLKV